MLTFTHKTTHARRAPLVAMIALCVALLTGCATGTPPTTAYGAEAEQLLSAHGLQGKTVKELVDELDRIPLAERPTTLNASVTAESLLLNDAQNQSVELGLPDDLMYVSVAPYQTQTHECFNHSLTGCVGELQDAEVHVLATSDAGGTVLDTTTRTFNNGFVGLWLPRGIEGTLTVTHGEKTGSVPFSTVGSEAKTCETTLRLG